MSTPVLRYMKKVTETENSTLPVGTIIGFVIGTIPEGWVAVDMYEGRVTVKAKKEK